MEKEWLIQRLNLPERRYENVTDVADLLTRDEMIRQLREIEAANPGQEFRGHNWINNERHGSDHYSFDGQPGEAKPSLRIIK